MTQVILYTREGCGLCEEAKHDLHTLSRTFSFELAEIDIRSDTALEKAYFDKIPVVKIGSELILFAPLTYDILREALIKSHNRKKKHD